MVAVAKRIAGAITLGANPHVDAGADDLYGNLRQYNSGFEWPSASCGVLQSRFSFGFAAIRFQVLPARGVPGAAVHAELRFDDRRAGLPAGSCSLWPLPTPLH